MAGEWTLLASSLGPKERGDSTLSVQVIGAVVEDANADALGDFRVERGELSEDDPSITSGERADLYRYAGDADETLVVDLRSLEFDPYLIVTGPNGEYFENDDFEGQADRSVLFLTLPSAGEYRIYATSFQPELFGSYVLRMGKSTVDGLEASEENVERGELTSSDLTDFEGKYTDYCHPSEQPR